jgi:CheY-like chemotaxis protein
MARPRILLAGGNPLVAPMLIEHLQQGDRYDLESVEYCDEALAKIHRGGVDLVLVLSLHVPWRMWPGSHAPAGRIDLTNAILFLKHMRAVRNPPPIILISGSPFAEAEEEALANGAFAFLAKPVNLAELDRYVVLALESRKDRPI